LYCSSGFTPTNVGYRSHKDLYWRNKLWRYSYIHVSLCHPGMAQFGTNGIS